MRAVWLVPLLAACGEDMRADLGLTGDWSLALTCDAAVDAVPGCGGEMASLVRWYEPKVAEASLAQGEHRTLLPGVPDPDGSYSGVAGLVLADWADGLLALELVVDADDPFASPGDAAAWATHRLVITGQPGKRCWDGRWAWTSDDGVEAEGDVAATRRGRTCE